MYFSSAAECSMYFQLFCWNQRFNRTVVFKCTIKPVVLTVPLHPNSQPTNDGWWAIKSCRTTFLANEKNVGLWLADFRWSTADTWPLCGKSLRYGSTNQANSAFHPFRVSNWVVIHVITWILWWRPLNGRRRLRVAVWPQGQSPICAGLSLQPISSTLALSVTKSAAAVCGAI